MQAMKARPNSNPGIFRPTGSTVGVCSAAEEAAPAAEALPPQGGLAGGFDVPLLGRGVAGLDADQPVPTQREPEDQTADDDDADDANDEADDEGFAEAVIHFFWSVQRSNWSVVLWLENGLTWIFIGEQRGLGFRSCLKMPSLVLCKMRLVPYLLTTLPPRFISSLLHGLADASDPRPETAVPRAAGARADAAAKVERDRSRPICDRFETSRDSAHTVTCRNGILTFLSASQQLRIPPQLLTKSSSPLYTPRAGES
ncbi:uncharacterized protein B0I36DRAFT_433964 [Microdochium trichocladiopsis]|uniref:Uncharacterized protein n=1 Tax=Microdochium trichocladiopsis TaxID=1682393 RepID=A0A9P8XZG0_9PEZI|nr:uncharacterized protein B0I36DRAFT_433964 [Microdochium trichocladiopsis]KAH7026550.1 hypothetical protein B0I36DRAFT_433964 [Microdochium trichocladiopsis]